MVTIYIPVKLVAILFLPGVLVIACFFFGGPVNLWMLLLGMWTRRLKLIRAYTRTGVKTAGIVTQAAVKRPLETLRERRRRIARGEELPFPEHCEIRYAYISSNVGDVVVQKDFVSISTNKLRNGRLFDVTELPGRTGSGVPSFLVPPTSDDDQIVLIILSGFGGIVLSTSLVMLTYLCLSSMVIPDADVSTTCIAAISVVFVPAFPVAFLMNGCTRAAIPGRVLSEWSVNDLSIIPENDCQLIREDYAAFDYDHLRLIPLNEAARVLADEELIASILPSAELQSSNGSVEMV